MEIPFDTSLLSSRVVFGTRSLGSVKDLSEEVGFRRLFVIHSKSAAAAYEVVRTHLGDRCVGESSEVAQHVPERLVGPACRMVQRANADAVITIGGGAATGLGKALAVTTGLGLVAVPTTYAGSEMTPIYGTTGSSKRTGRASAALPKLVIYDPGLLTGLPPSVVAASGLNAMAHAVAGLSQAKVGPLVHLAAAGAIARLRVALPLCVRRPDDLAGQQQALVGAFLAGWTLAHGGVGIHHKLAHVLGGDLGLVHADIHAVLLPFAVEYLQNGSHGDALRLAFLDNDPARTVRGLAKEMGAPASLAALGVQRADLPLLAGRLSGEDASAGQVILERMLSAEQR